VLGICHSFILFKSCYHCNIRVHCSSTRILAVSEWWNAELECWMLWTIEYLTHIYGSHFHKMKNGRRDGYIRAAYCHSSRGMYFIQITDIASSCWSLLQKRRRTLPNKQRNYKKRSCRVQHYDVKRLSMARYLWYLSCIMHYS